MADLLDLRRLSLRTRLPEAWLQEQAELNRIPALKVGRKLLFNSEAVEAAICALAGEGLHDQLEEPKKRENSGA